MKQDEKMILSFVRRKAFGQGLQTTILLEELRKTKKKNRFGSCLSGL
jgi:hypothetical protein